MMKKFVYLSAITKTIAALACIVFISLVYLPQDLYASDDNTTITTAVPNPAAASAESAKYIAAAIAVGLGSLAGGIAVAVVGSAALGAAAERPEIMMRALLFVGLAEGIAIYGVAIAAFILTK